jgi:monothiol glutaredoxin
VEFFFCLVFVQKTIPQVYIGGEFVGGSDTLMEMMKSGDLDKMIDAKGVKRIVENKQ